MTFSPLFGMSLKAVQIDVPSQAIASSTTVTLGNITDSSIISITGNTITLPGGRDYFLTASINCGQSTGANAEFSFITVSDGIKLPNQAGAYYYYTSTDLNIDTYSGNIATILTGASTTEIQLKKTIHTGSTSIYKDNVMAYVANSPITIFYTD